MKRLAGCVALRSPNGLLSEDFWTRVSKPGPGRPYDVPQNNVQRAHGFGKRHPDGR